MILDNTPFVLRMNILKFTLQSCAVVIFVLNVVPRRTPKKECVPSKFACGRQFSLILSSSTIDKTLAIYTKLEKLEIDKKKPGKIRVYFRDFCQFRVYFRVFCQWWMKSL